MVRKAFLLFFCLCLCTPFCFGQGATIWVIDTVAGGAVYDGLPATSTPLAAPSGLWIAADGAIWLAETGNHVVRKIDPATGIMRVVVGAGTARENSTPIAGTSLLLERPGHIVGDASGNIYFTETGSHRVHKLTPDGQVRTIVGTGAAGFSGDGGPAGLAKLNGPTGIALDAAGNLYIMDAGNYRVRKVDLAGNITTIAGTGDYSQESGDGGPALRATLGGQLQGLAFDPRGNLHLASWATIRRIDAGSGNITTVAGMPGPSSCAASFTSGAPATTQPLCRPWGMTFDPDGNMYFTWGGGLAKLTVATGTLTQLAAWNVNQTGISRDAGGKIVFAAAVAGRVLSMAPAGGQYTVIAGTDEVFDGPALRATLSLPLGLSLDIAGNLYIADGTSNRIRRYEPSTGQITSVVGGGSKQLADGIPATSASLWPPGSVCVDSQGNIWFDQVYWLEASLWKMDARSGTLARVAGDAMTGQPNNAPRFSGDGGPALQARFGGVGPSGIACGAPGAVFISDGGNHRVRRVDLANGIIDTIAGNGTEGNSGDGGPATAAAVGNPEGLAIDKQGQLLIAARGGVRRVNLSTGVITAVQARYSSDGSAHPLGANALAVDKDGNIFAVWGSTLSQVRASDNVEIALASGVDGFFGDGGPAQLARLATASGRGLAADAGGNVYVADGGNNRIRKLTRTIVQPILSVSPSTLFFNVLQGSSLIAAQSFTVGSGNNLPFNWTLQLATTAGGNWLAASRTSGSAPANVILTVDGSKLGAGTYRGTVTISAPGTTNTTQTVDVVLTVTGAAGALLGLSQQYLNFQAVQGGSNPAAQTLSISNVGSGTLSWSATAETSSGGQWLRISSGLGTAPSSLTISADITGLAQGVYQGQVTLRNLTASETKIISVVLTVTKTQPILLPTQTGFLFVGIEGSLVIGPQSFAIQNAGQGRMDWQVQVNLPAGGDWLRVSPTSGTSDAAVQAAPTVTLLVDPSKLRAGVSVGLLTITASGALNAPQTGIVLVNMLARGSLPVGTINPLGVIFTAASGASGALTQGISIASTGGQALQYLARTQTQAGGSWLSVTPEQGVLLSSVETAGLSVQARPTGLSAGVYVGSVILTFGTGVTQEVAVALVVSPVATSSSVPGTVAHRPWTLDLGPWTSAAACAPRRMVIVETKLGNRFSLQSGWPIPMLVQAVDDCGSAVSTATVAAGFTGNEPPLVFQNLRNGNYAATWVPATKGSIGVTIRAVASGLDDGVFQFSGTLGEASKLPLVFRDGWVNAASFDRYKPLAPGMIFSLFGSNLAEGKNVASQIPLPRTLGNIKATIGGYEAPLFYADSGQVNAQVPFELTPGVATLVVTGKDAAGAPGTVTIVSAQPGVFTVSQSGTGQGVVLDGLNNLADSSHAVKAGEAVVIYATGLGTTNPPVATGQAAPAVPPLALVTTPVKVTIGGVEAAVEFAGLAPGFVGLHQVNARVPPGAPAGNAVPLVLTQNGVASNTVTIAVK